VNKQQHLEEVRIHLKNTEEFIKNYRAYIERMKARELNRTETRVKK
jgi:hypothetical protein